MRGRGIQLVHVLFRRGVVDVVVVFVVFVFVVVVVDVVVVVVVETRPYH